MIKFYQAEPYIPPSLSVTVVTSYVSHTGAPRINTVHVGVGRWVLVVYVSFGCWVYMWVLGDACTCRIIARGV